MSKQHDLTQHRLQKLRFHRCQFCHRLQDNPNFWLKVHKVEGAGCWEWIGSRDYHGYGRFTVRAAGGDKAARYPAHCWALEYTLGRPIREGYYALHKCDNPRCVRPSHLYEGTIKENSRDMVNRGRMHVWDRKGEANGRAKLTAVQVAAIRAEYQPKSALHNQYGLAARYGVSRSTIRALLSGPNWKGGSCPA